MSRRVVISGLGVVSGLGIGIADTWQGLVEGRSAIDTIKAFDASGFDCGIAAEAPDYAIKDFVPKTYRKATKVMARDVELAVIAADLAAKDAGLITKGNAAPDQQTTYTPNRVGAQIGAGLIAAELNELTAALVESRNSETGEFDIHHWGGQGMQNLFPLWLLKYLPNMLACHVTIIHEAQGPSNTITCAEASGILSIGESLRVIQRDAADACFCGGTESKLNPMALLRQHMTGRLTRGGNDNPKAAVRPFDQAAQGTALGEGGGIVILEAMETFEKRNDAKGYAEIVGFGASHSINRGKRNLTPDAQGEGIALAIRAAMREANVQPDEIDLIVPFGLGMPEYDKAEAAALRGVFGEALGRIPVASNKASVGNTCAGVGGLDVAIAAKAVAEQMLPARINCDKPIIGINAGNAKMQSASIRYALTYSTGAGGQNAALVLKRLDLD